MDAMRKQQIVQTCCGMKSVSLDETGVLAACQVVSIRIT